MQNMKASLRGFTLLEVMIALLIFSIGSIALTKAMSQVVGQQSRLEQKTFAGWIADNKFKQIIAVDGFPDIGETRQEIEYARRQWQVEEKVIKTPNPLMRRIEITVSLLDKEDNSSRPVHSITGFTGDL